MCCSAPGEDLQRAGDVEALDAVEEDDENGALRHASDSCGAGRHGRNDEFPTFPAIGRHGGPGPADRHVWITHTNQSVTCSS